MTFKTVQINTAAALKISFLNDQINDLLISKTNYNCAFIPSVKSQKEAKEFINWWTSNNETLHDEVDE